MSTTKSAMLSMKQSIRDGFKDVNWRNVFSLDNAVSTVVMTLIGILILAIAHSLGKKAYRAIRENASSAESLDAKRFKTSRDRAAVEQKRKSTGGSVDAFDETLETQHGIIADVTASSVYWVIMVVAFVAVLGLLGIQIASMIALLSTVAIVIGFSLQGTMSDIASGFLLAFFQTYDIGDVIKVNDVEGRVRDFRFVNTLVEDIGSRALITIPNNTVQSSIVQNLSRNRYHNFVFEVRLSNSDYLRNGDRVDHAAITDAIRTELSNSEKYPDVIRHDRIKVLSGVSGMDEAGTKILIAVPFVTGPNLFLHRGAVMTGVRTKLHSLGVRMLDKDYTYVTRETNDMNNHRDDDSDYDTDK